MAGCAECIRLLRISHPMPLPSPNRRGGFFLFSFARHNADDFPKCQNGRQKTGILFLISCLGVPSHAAAVIRLSVCYSSTNWNLPVPIYNSFPIQKDSGIFT